MGNSLGVWFREWFYGKEVRILMCGLDAAGKTTLLYKLKLGEVVMTIPTIGFFVETVNYKGLNIASWDTSGREGNLRPLWKHYYPNTDVLIFVVDSRDHERMPECCLELWNFLGEEDLKNCLLLVLANKQDIPGAMSVAEITEHLKLESIQNRTWHIQGTSATIGDGLCEGLDWMQQELANRKAKEAVTKPLQETKDSFVPSWFSTLSS